MWLVLLACGYTNFLSEFLSLLGGVGEGCKFPGFKPVVRSPCGIGKNERYTFRFVSADIGDPG
jgi:hypothetical protein